MLAQEFGTRTNSSTTYLIVFSPRRGRVAHTHNETWWPRERSRRFAFYMWTHTLARGALFITLPSRQREGVAYLACNRERQYQAQQ